MLVHATLILPDIHIVKLSSVTSLLLDLLGYFSACENSVTLVGAEDLY
jgi:hypothetical protein